MGTLWQENILMISSGNNSKKLILGIPIVYDHI